MKDPRQVQFRQSTLRERWVMGGRREGGEESGPSG